MPVLHKLTPVLSVLQDRGHRVALLTDGRMSGASGKVPAAIHLSPEAAVGGAIARLLDGDRIILDAVNGELRCDIDDADLADFGVKLLLLVPNFTFSTSVFSAGRLEPPC